MNAEGTKPKRPRRRWLQFTLRGLLILMLLSAVGAWWLSIEMGKARREEQALARLKAEADEFGVVYTYQYRPTEADSFAADLDAVPPGPRWLRSLLGDAFFDEPGHLVFSGEHFSDEAAQAFYDLPSLQGLEIVASEQSLSRESARAVGSLKKLRSLHLYGVQLDAATLGELKSLTELEFFGVPFADAVSPEAAAAFVEGKTKLHSLVLSAPEFEPRALAQLGKLPALAELDLGRATFEPAELEALGQTPLEQLGLTGPHINDECLRHVAAIPSLKSLALSEARFHAEGLRALAELPALERLLFQKTTLDDDSLRELSNFQSLKQVSFYDVPLSDDDLSALSNCESLEELSIGMSAVSAAGLAALSGLPNLHTLTISQAAFTEADFALLANFPSLRSLRIHPTKPKFTDAAMPFLAVLPLEELELPQGITAASVPLILQMKNLKRLRLPYNFPYAATQAVIAGLPNCRVTGGTTRSPQPAKPK